MKFYETPGQNPDCLTMGLGDMIFTGDSYSLWCQHPTASCQ